ncbi:LADA_0G04324g1_1 [Lachancea dasiensis]|uniref:Mannosyl-oligosaccharide glucosidase n=1 Tax=Lachancea dasiensis TaxID=1072105 RepID=A0A1G4JS60_9SACH|nr:LADA_0G04324g1_1 [Lachancea dasiensis]
MHLNLAFVAISAISSVLGAELGNSGADFEEYGKHTNQSLLWAPYRSNCYFGIRPRNVNESPLMMGLMWFDSSEVKGVNQLRHFVDTGDKLDKYGYESYDPRLGGKEVIIDGANNLNLTIHFAKSRNGENWGARIYGAPLDASKAKIPSLILYLNQNGEGSHLSTDLLKRQDKKTINLEGSALELGDYEIKISDNFGQYYERGPSVAHDLDSSKPSHFSFNVPDDEVWKARDIFQTMLTESVQKMVLSGTKMNPLSLPSLLMIRNLNNFAPGNFHFVQKTFDSHQPFEFDVIFNKKGSKQPIRSSGELTTLISWTMSELDARFNNKFSIADPDLKRFAQETLANLMGGIGYFHGTQKVDRTTEFDEEQFEKIDLKEAREEGPLQLFSSVPSRAFFPRGFYWDEGFHLLQMKEYDFDLTLEILQSWFALIEDDSGWIARELILGSEARSKVPEEFQVQNPNIANPPTLLLCFSEMLTLALEENLIDDGLSHEMSVTGVETGELLRRPELLTLYAEKIYPKLLRHYEWWTDGQRGYAEEYIESLGLKMHPEEVFRWVGRTFTHCLPSGLDDYPRAQPPDVAELHVDALSWAGVMTRSMKQISQVLGLTEEVQRLAKIEENIVDNLDSIHWNEQSHTYCDVTIDDDLDEVRKFVCHEGYISLMPFALKLVPKDSEKLKWFVELMGDTTKIFSEYGILSLSKQDSYFETGEIYWRGPVWINMNYLFLDSLAFYFQDSDQQQDAITVTKAKQLYRDLRENLISNMYKVWDEDGYVYENYNHNNGRGSGVQHFTGWSSLIVNILGRLPEEL